MKNILIINRKGGVGKTLVADELAFALDALTSSRLLAVPKLNLLVVDWNTRPVTSRLERSLRKVS